MKKILVFIFLFSLFFFGIKVSASEVTTEPEITTELEITTEVATSPVGDLFEEPLIESVIPKVQLGFQILSFVYLVGVTIVAFKQRIDVAVAKKREKDALDELTVEQRLRQVEIGSIAIIMDVLDIIVQNSKMKTEDKLSITKMISTNQAQMTEVLDLAAQITNLDKTDISNILSSLGDLATLATAGYSAIKTGDISKLNVTKDEVGE